MKRNHIILSFVLALLLFWAQGARGVVVFESGKKYSMKCKAWSNGYLGLGSSNENSTPLYHTGTDEITADCYWIITRVDNNRYTIKNDFNDKYLVFDNVRTDSKRYVDFRAEAKNDSSFWNIQMEDGYIMVNNLADASQYFNVRTNGMVGTYQGMGDNGIFTLYDEKGAKVEALDKPIPWMPNFLIDLSFGGTRLSFDNLYNTYLFPLPWRFDRKDFSPILTFTMSDSIHKVYINDREVINGEPYTFTDVRGGGSYDIRVRSDEGTVSNARVTFTFLPVVEITGGAFNTSSFNSGTIRVVDPDNPYSDEVSLMKARHRGASASWMSKKSYAVKLVDKMGNSIDRGYFGLRSDNNWIFDAMAVDHGRMRNRVSTDLWLDYSVQPYYHDKEPNLINGTRGRFVEVILNGKYAGLYCMTEKVDRKQLKLRKYQDVSPPTGSDGIRGQLYKAVQWGYTVWMGYDSSTKTYPMTKPGGYSNTSTTWAGGWESKYPDLEEGEKIDWDDLYNAVSVPASYSDADFRKNVEEYFDLPVVRDYYLLIELILGFDNNGKNMYYYNYDRQSDKKLSITPWDMDGTWGRIWDGSKAHCENAAMDFALVLRDNHGQHALFKRLAELNWKNWNKQLAERYSELRAGHFSPDSLLERFDTYKKQFEKSGAFAREIKRWGGADGITLDLYDEYEYLNAWIHQRIRTLDVQYGYKPIGINATTVSDFISLRGGKNEIMIRSNVARPVKVYSITGTLVRSCDIDEGITRIDGMPSGVYLVMGKKVIVK